MNSVVVSVMLLIVCVSVLVAMISYAKEGLSDAVELLLTVLLDLACVVWVLAYIFGFAPLVPLFFVSSLCIFMSSFYLIGLYFFDCKLSGTQIFKAIATSIIAISGTIGLLATTYIP